MRVARRLRVYAGKKASLLLAGARADKKAARAPLHKICLVKLRLPKKTLNLRSTRRRWQLLVYLARAGCWIKKAFSCWSTFDARRSLLVAACARAFKPRRHLAAGGEASRSRPRLLVMHAFFLSVGAAAHWHSTSCRHCASVPPTQVQTSLEKTNKILVVPLAAAPCRCT